MASSGGAGAGPGEEEEGGELVFFGCTDWKFMGRKDASDRAERAATFPNLLLPARIAPLEGVSISFVAAGTASCHCVALSTDGRCYTWGRNETGQLGHGNLDIHHSPTVVAALSKHKVVHAAAGRGHTVVVTAEGSSFSWGGNKHGQLGSGSLKSETEKSPVKALVSSATSVACGADFTMWLSSAAGAGIVAAGLPQYGQLGDGSDHEYNAKEGAVKLMYEAHPHPKAIAALAAKGINRVACGNNHTVAADEKGNVYTWGFGGHGRLGHKEQKDEWLPRIVDTLQRGNVLPASGIVAAGAAFSAATAGGGQLYMWGKVKAVGENWMYPKPVFDLSGWNVRCMDCGNMSSMVGADAGAESSCISWGTASYGELGYGPDGPKSSANPKKVEALEGLRVLRVACGVGHCLAVVAGGGDAAAALEKLDVFEPQEAEEEAEAEEEPAPKGGKRKAKGAAAAEAGGGAAAKKGRGKGAAASAAAAAAAPSGGGRGKRKAPAPAKPAPAKPAPAKGRGRSKK